MGLTVDVSVLLRSTTGAVSLVDGIVALLPQLATVGSVASFDDGGNSSDVEATDVSHAVGVVVVDTAEAILFGRFKLVDVVDEVTDGGGGSTNTLDISNRNVTPNDDVSFLSFNNIISVAIISCVAM